MIFANIKDLKEYIHSKFIVSEQRRDQYDFPRLNEITGQERRDIMKYFEILRQSGIVNMFGSYPILNWTRDDLYRFLYGERNDPESLENQIEEEEYDNEDGENDSDISMLEEKLIHINYLLDNFCLRNAFSSWECLSSKLSICNLNFNLSNFSLVF